MRFAFARIRADRFAAATAGAVGLVVAGAMMVGTRDFALDDAWIHLSYAKSLRGGDGLSYNPGDWETGFSSPLWVLVLAAWPLTGNPVVSVKLLGALLHAATAWVGAKVTAELVRERTYANRTLPRAPITLMGGLLIACVPTSVQAATSGMEVPLATASLMAVVLAILRGRSRAAGLGGWLCVWARPELLITVCTLAGAVWVTHRFDPSGRRRAASWGAAGTLFGLALWVGYCLAVSGHPWPNAQYVKGAGGGLDGLVYLQEEVLVWQPWLVSLTGVALLGAAGVADRRERVRTGWSLLLATAATWLTIAVTRPLHPGVLFFESRYFAVVAPLPWALVPAGVAAALRPGRSRRLRWLGWASLGPVVLVCAVQIRQLRARLLDHTEDTFELHTTPARELATRVPADAVVGVEGAGASRYFTPRSMRIVDLVGLNDRDSAHRHFDPVAKMCGFVRRGMTHLLIPTDWVPQFSPPFAVRPLQVFKDPRYTQVRPARPAAVVLLEIGSVAPDWAARCR